MFPKFLRTQRFIKNIIEINYILVLFMDLNSGLILKKFLLKFFL